MNLFAKNEREELRKIAMALDLWHRGHDVPYIAEQLNKPESVVDRWIFGSLAIRQQG